MSLLSVGKNFTRMFDQYSVICVFGSVVGCVVVPLITQSMESLIFSAIVISLTAKTLLAASRDPPVQEDRRRSKDRDYQHDRKQKRNNKKVAQVQIQPLVNIEVVRRQQKEDLKKQEEHRKAEKERRVEEKRDKRARKKEDRIKRKEEERKEKEKEEQLRRERQETRLMRRQQEREMKERDRVYPFHCDSLENIESIIRQQKPIRRERKNSSSSSTSSSSAHSPTTSVPRRIRQQYSHPVRASSDPQLAPPIPSSHLYSPQPSHNPPRAWQSLPRTTSQWQTKTDLPTVPKVDPNSRGQSPSHYYVPNHLCWLPLGPAGSNQAVYPTIHPELVKSQSFGELGLQSWAPTTHPSMTGCAAGALFSSGPNSVGNDGCYSLFSEQQSPFGFSLLSPDASSERCSSADVMTTSGSSTSEKSSLTAAKQGFDEWPVL